MKDFTCLSESELIETLAVYTADYTTALKSKTPDEEIAINKRLVDSLVDEICRRNAANNKMIAAKQKRNEPA